MAARDLIVTWPQAKPFREYLEALAVAQVNGEQINYRVGSAPTKLRLYDPERGRSARCYRVYDGKVRGFTDILSVCRRGWREVQNLDTGGHWPPGWYIVCSPIWNEVVPYPMRGFQGWRYYDYIEHMSTLNG